MTTNSHRAENVQITSLSQWTIHTSTVVARHVACTKESVSKTMAIKEHWASYSPQKLSFSRIYCFLIIERSKLKVADADKVGKYF